MHYPFIGWSKSRAWSKSRRLGQKVVVCVRFIHSIPWTLLVNKKFKTYIVKKVQGGNDEVSSHLPWQVSRGRCPVAGALLRAALVASCYEELFHQWIYVQFVFPVRYHRALET